MAHIQTLKFVRGDLPHWIVADATYFVTFRLHGSLPAALLAEFRAERERCAQRATNDPAAMIELQRRQLMRAEAMLDHPPTRALLLNATARQVVFDNLVWLEKERGWQIWAACVMPTHVHMLMRNTAGRTTNLLDDLNQFKGYTARRVNACMERAGRLWAREDFDHWCRSQDKIESAARYIRDNPVNAGLVPTWRDWSWTRVDPDVFRAPAMNA